MTRRTRQVGELLKEELDDIIRREVKDPRIGFFSITQVEVPPDLRTARVFVSVLGDDDERAATLSALEKASKNRVGRAAPTRFHGIGEVDVLNL